MELTYGSVCWVNIFHLNFDDGEQENGDKDKTTNSKSRTTIRERRQVGMKMRIIFLGPENTKE